MKSIIRKGLFVLMMVPMLALGVSVLSGDVANAQAISGGIGGGAASAKGDGTAETLFGDGGIFKTVTNILLYIIGAVSVIMLIIGGIRYVVSGGDQSAVTGAKNTILYAIVGIVVAFLAYAAVNFVTTNLGQATN
ncbi:MAG: hypothetical protein WAU02_00835 [Candidatus Saccharimonadales bacterium]